VDLEQKEILNEIYNCFETIQIRMANLENHLGIVKDLDGDVDDIELSVNNYCAFAEYDLKIQTTTISVHRRVLISFLEFSNGEITHETIKAWLSTDESEIWKNQQLKALRRYCRDFLKLGKWIERFKITDTTKVNLFSLPTKLQLMQFCEKLPDFTRLIFLMLKDTGLRESEILQIKIQDIDFENNCIDASQFHKGSTKHSYLSFFTPHTGTILKAYISDNLTYFKDSEAIMFPIAVRTVQDHFSKVANDLEIMLTPKTLRQNFSSKLTDAGIKDRYIDALQGRIKKSVLAKHYTEYSLEKLKEQYSLVSPLLEF